MIQVASKNYGVSAQQIFAKIEQNCLDLLFNRTSCRVVEGYIDAVMN
jgi:hypothetical protein